MENIDPEKILLFTMIESDNKNINNNTGNVTTPRLYEQEAINCFTAWREKAGWLKDIEIICFCPSNNKPSSETIQKLEELKIEYIEQYLPESETMSYGFFMVPLIGKLIEEKYHDKYLIHIDLDMNIIKPLPETLFSDNVIMVGQYDIESSKTQRNKLGWKLPLDTGFTISHTSTNFYYHFWNFFKESLKKENYKKDTDWIAQGCELYFLEEYIADKLYNKNILPIKAIQYYQVGEGYVSVSELSDENLSTVLFWHEHLIIDKNDSYNASRFKQKIEFFRRMKQIEKA